MLNTWWFWVGLAITIFWCLGAHNRLMRLCVQVTQRFLALETLLLQYPELVHEAVTLAATAPAGWRQAVGFDLGTEHWNLLQDASNQAAMSLARMNEHPLNVNSGKEVVQAVNRLALAWQELVHPDVFFLSVPEDLRQRWHELGVVIQPELQRFNHAVENYNLAIAQFPALFLARSLRFEPTLPMQFDLSPNLNTSLGVGAQTLLELN